MKSLETWAWRSAGILGLVTLVFEEFLEVRKKELPSVWNC